METDLDRAQGDRGGVVSASSSSFSSAFSFASSFSSLYSNTNNSLTSFNLPPISTIYTFSAGEASTNSVNSSGASSTTSHTRNNPVPAHLQRWYHHTTQPADPALLHKRLTAADTAEIAARELVEDNDDDDEHQLSDADKEGSDGDQDHHNFVFENGRRYHANALGRALYPMPNDESEQERDDMKHKLTLWMMHERLFYAPVEGRLQEGGMVFDLGTGTGEWVMEVGKRYGNSQIYGCDLSPIQPEYVWDNVYFSADDFEEDWADHPENAFDYIHLRHVAFSVRDPEALLRRAMRHLKPGGYIEFQELVHWPQCDDETVTPTTPYAFRDFCYWMREGLAALGLESHLINRIPSLLRAQGFEDVTEVQHKLPIGRWAHDRCQREKGIWFVKMILMEGLPAICKRPFTMGLGWKNVQVEMFLVDVRKSLLDAGKHVYFPFVVVYGRKPLEGQASAVGGK